MDTGPHSSRTWRYVYHRRGEEQTTDIQHRRDYVQQKGPSSLGAVIINWQMGSKSFSCVLWPVCIHATLDDTQVVARSPLYSDSKILFEPAPSLFAVFIAAAPG